MLNALQAGPAQVGAEDGSLLPDESPSADANEATTRAIVAMLAALAPNAEGAEFTLFWDSVDVDKNE